MTFDPTTHTVPCVLVVEDDPIWQRLIQHTLNKAEVNVVEARTLNAARDALREQMFDLVVADYELPDGTGLDLFEDVARTRMRRFVLATGHSDPEDLHDARSVLVDRFLTKPFRSSELSSCLVGLLDCAGSRSIGD